MIQNISAPPAAAGLVAYAPLISAAAVVVVGLIAAGIAYRQWRTAHSKLQLDLYDKRIPVYQACKSALTALTLFGRLRPASAAEFSIATAQARYLFDDYIAGYVDRLSEIISEAPNRDAPPQPEPPNPSAERWAWYRAERDRVDAVFAPYLRLSGRRVRKGKPPAVAALPD